eukprot:79775_1
MNVLDTEEGEGTPNQMVVLLVQLGIGSKNACIRAVNAVNNSNVDEASEWLLNHSNDANINDPIIQNNVNNKGNKSAQPKHTNTKYTSMNDLQKWCLNNGFSMDFYHRLTRPPLYIDTLHKLKGLTSENDINDLVKELGLRFGKKVSFIDAMKQLKKTDIKLVNIQSNNKNVTQETKQQDVDEEFLKCNRCGEKFRPSDWNTQNILLEKGTFYVHLLCHSLNNQNQFKLNNKPRLPKINKHKSSKISIVNIEQKINDKTYYGIKFAIDPQLTQEEIDGECHVRDSVIPYRNLKVSNFLKLYKQTKKAPTYNDIVTHLPKELIANFKQCYTTICKTYSNESTGNIIGRTCVQAWTHEEPFSACKFYCKLNAALISDHSQLLTQWMYLIRGLNQFLVNTRPKQALVCYRKSDLSMEQFNRIKVGKKYRIIMYTATSTDKNFVKTWIRNSGKFYWKFNVPKDCYNACCIAEYSYHGEESEVLMPPYSSIQIVSKNNGYITANVLDNKQCSELLPAIVA